MIKLIAALAAVLTLGTVSAQEPLPEDVMNRISYGTGMNIAQQLAQNPELNRDVLIQGFEDALSQQLDEDRVTYAEGAGIAMQVAQRGMNPEQVLQAIKDQAAGVPSPYTDEQMMEAHEQAQQFMAQQQAQQQQASQASAEENLRAGQEFLAENAGRDGVMETLTGLQYEVLEEGEGDSPEANAVVRVHYTGRLLNGQVFDSSVERGEPVEFPLDQVIPGWTEGLQLMSPGARFRFWIPSELAYGQNAPPSIGPNQVLDFEVELLEVK